MASSNCRRAGTARTPRTKRMRSGRGSDSSSRHQPAAVGFGGSGQVVGGSPRRHGYGTCDPRRRVVLGSGHQNQERVADDSRSGGLMDKSGRAVSRPGVAHTGYACDGSGCAPGSPSRPLRPDARCRVDGRGMAAGRQGRADPGLSGPHHLVGEFHGQPRQRLAERAAGRALGLVKK
jgi:hypothetical protein